VAVVSGTIAGQTQTLLLGGVKETKPIN